MTLPRGSQRKEMEKLIEDLAALFDKCAPEEVRRAAAKNFIESIGKAYADGELELPDEYYRGKGVTVSQIEATKALYDRRGIHDDIDKWVAEGRKEALLDLLDIAHPVIALSPAGTGKEEEK